MNSHVWIREAVLRRQLGVVYKAYYQLESHDGRTQKCERSSDAIGKGRGVGGPPESRKYTTRAHEAHGMKRSHKSQH